MQEVTLEVVNPEPIPFSISDGEAVTMAIEQFRYVEYPDSDDVSY